MPYRVREFDGDGRPITGIDTADRTVGPGDLIDGAPTWLVKQGYVERVEDPPAPRKSRARKAQKGA